MESKNVSTNFFMIWNWKETSGENVYQEILPDGWILLKKLALAKSSYYYKEHQQRNPLRQEFLRFKNNSNSFLSSKQDSVKPKNSLTIEILKIYLCHVSKIL